MNFGSQQVMHRNLEEFCGKARNHNCPVAIVTGAGGVARGVARALVQERGYAVLLVSRGVVNLNRAYEHALASRHGKVVGMQCLDLADSAQVEHFGDALTSAAITAGVQIRLVVHAVGMFAWDGVGSAARDLLLSNRDAKIHLASFASRFFHKAPWDIHRQIFIGSVAAGFASADMFCVQFPNGEVRTQYQYAEAQFEVRVIVRVFTREMGRERVLLLEPAGMADTETMWQFPPAIRDQIAGQTVHTEVVRPMFDWLDGGKSVHAGGIAVSTKSPAT